MNDHKNRIHRPDLSDWVVRFVYDRKCDNKPQDTERFLWAQVYEDMRPAVRPVPDG